MIVMFVLGAIAAWGAPQLEPQVKTLLARLLPVDDVTATELRGIALALALFAAAVIGTLLGGQGAIALTIGAVIGVLGTRIYQRIKVARAPDYDN